MPDPTRIAGATPDAQRITLARLGAVTGEPDQVSEWVDVQFNPASLQLQISNELKDTTNNERKQYIAKSNAKLTMELLFDTTHSGQDVTMNTRKIQSFIAPPLAADDAARQQDPPPVVMFEWGRVKFKGIAESYKETIDFFSATGVPLRASVNLTLSRQDQVFDSTGGGRADVGQGDAARALDAPAQSAAAAANAAQTPQAARGVAEANGLESLRFSAGASLTLQAQVTLKPPVAFAAGGIGVGGGIGIGGGAGIGIGGGAGIGIGAGGGIGISAGAAAGAGISAGAGFGAGVSVGAGASFGAGAGVSLGSGASIGASAGMSGLSRLSATEGAFAGLRVSTAGPSTARINTSRLLPPARSATMSTDRHALFQVGGKATSEGGAGLRAEVGAGRTITRRLTFD